MLEEKNDNLLAADGNVENNSVDGTTTTAKVLEPGEPSDFPAEDNVVTPFSEETVSETNNQTAIDAIAEINAEESEDETLK